MRTEFPAWYVYTSLPQIFQEITEPLGSVILNYMVNLSHFGQFSALVLSFWFTREGQRFFDPLFALPKSYYSF